MTVALVRSVAALAGTPPGPRLAALLAGLDVSRLSGSQCVEVMRARFRQVNHERGLFLRAVAEVVLRDQADGLHMLGEPSEFAFDEVRAALVLTRRAADAVGGLAYDLVCRLPAVWAAMVAGALDEPRARIFADWTLELSDEHARAVCAALLPAAPGWTTGQLVEQIKRCAIGLDPDWARRRYEQVIRDRRVVGSRNPDGSANLAGYDLPVEQVAAACERIDRLAKAAKNAGRTDRIDHLRAELFLGMTDGSYAGLDDAAILGRLTAGPPRPAGPDAALATPAAADPAVDAAAGAFAATDDRAVGDADDLPVRAAGRRAGRGVEVAVRLSTLLGLDRCPGELVGWGPVHAELARDIVTRHAAGRWRWVVTDPAGYPVAVGPLRRRPSAVGRAGRDGVVEVQVPEPTLHALAGRDLPDGWRPVVAEILVGLTGGRVPAGHRDDDPERRLPGAGLRRWLRIRDRTCIFPGCRMPARDTDADHTVEHARGGGTVPGNLGAACRHDHRLRHEGGWRLNQVRPGHFVWISRLGRVYPRRPPPAIAPLPDPMPTTDAAQPVWSPRASPDEPGWAQSTCMEPERPPVPRPPPPPPPPKVAPEEDIPPF